MPIHLLEERHYERDYRRSNQRRGTSMSKSGWTKSLITAAIIGLSFAHGATAQETKRQGLPLGDG
jgi:hypothetical protein